MTTKTYPVSYRILVEDTQALLIDVQEKLTPHIFEHEHIIKKNGNFNSRFTGIGCTDYAQ